MGSDGLAIPWTTDQMLLLLTASQSYIVCVHTSRSWNYHLLNTSDVLYPFYVVVVDTIVTKFYTLTAQMCPDDKFSPNVYLSQTKLI